MDITYSAGIKYWHYIKYKIINGYYLQCSAGRWYRRTGLLIPAQTITLPPPNSHAPSHMQRQNWGKRISDRWHD
ncbi:hypothetical protein ACF0H5_009406 [Mactra antiquata]